MVTRGPVTFLSPQIPPQSKAVQTADPFYALRVQLNVRYFAHTSCPSSTILRRQTLGADAADPFALSKSNAISSADISLTAVRTRRGTATDE